MSSERVQRLIDKERLAAPERAANTPAVRRGGTDRWAFCKVAAGTGSTLVCYLGTDSGEEADEITVNFELLNCSNLSDGHLTLVDGSRIRVAKDGDDWWCVTPIEGSEDCE